MAYRIDDEAQASQSFASRLLGAVPTNMLLTLSAIGIWGAVLFIYWR